MMPEAGSYVMVDHHFANASQGAIGAVRGRRAGAGAADPEHHNIPATQLVPTDPVAQKAQLAFQSKCLACHSLGGRRQAGPDLLGVTKRHDAAWLARWLKSPEQMLQTDATAKAMLDRWKSPCRNLGPQRRARSRATLAYFKWADANVQPAKTAAARPLPPARRPRGRAG
jgi:nitrite reductase (NO-forming)